jgi:hypothetical protein
MTSRAYLFLCLTLLAGVQDLAAQDAADPMKAGRFDNGKMWTFDNPPLAYFQEEYGFQPDAAWFEKARLGALRIPGCSASFASPNGLVLTNHHCGRNAVGAVQQPGENLLDDGFYAKSLSEERRIPNYYADQLIQITDVTAEVEAAAASQQTDAERAQARQEAITAIVNRLKAAGADLHVEVISLYQGARYSAYTFRRYSDVRLVMTPELQMGYFGGDPDNFTFPRYCLDMTLYRLYGADGNPLPTEHYFRWNPQGAREGDPIFVIGNPGSTFRLETVAQLEFRRDVQEPYTLDFLNSRMAVLDAYLKAHPDAPDATAVRNQYFGLSNSQKLFIGRIKALNDPVVMARRRDAEQQFRAGIEPNAALQAQYGTLHDRMAGLQQQKRTVTSGAFFALTGNLESTLLRRAMLAQDYMSRKAAGATGEAVDRLANQFRTLPNQHPDLNRGYLVERLRAFRHYWGAEHPLTQATLKGLTPEAAAEALLATSVLADSARAVAAFNSNTLTTDDPAIQLVAAFIQAYQDHQSALAGLGAQQLELSSAIGRARFEVFGLNTPPDATFSLRIADGRVSSYAYNGTTAPSHTTFYGLYERYHAFGAGSAWDLPGRWRTPSATLDLGIPMNFVTTADIVGGNSGSGMINQNHELVGLIFDGNIESLSSSYIYLPESGARSVAVDVRAILEALDEVYDMDRVVYELNTGRLVPTEQEADRMRQ